MADIVAALDKDNRYQILKWWRHCEIGIDGNAGRVLREALHEISRRCEADDQREKDEANSRSLERSTDSAAGVDSHSMGGGKQ